MTAFLEPTSTELGAGWHPYGAGITSIVEGLDQHVHHPSTPANQGAEWTEGEPGGSTIFFRLEHSAEAGARTLWLYAPHVPVGLNWQYGWGVIGNHASGLEPASVGWSQLAVSASAVLNELWVEVMPLGAGGSGHTTRLSALYCQVGAVAATNALRMIDRKSVV